MSPHALSSSDASPYQTSPSSLDDDIPSLMDAMTCNLHRYGDDEIQDLVCVGFGPASLAIAVALHDSMEPGVTRLSIRAPKVRFLEKQPRFRWHAGMLITGARMQITFIKDMATLRNPQSQFTFLNYLHEKDRLVAFTNLNTFLPQRVEYEDYMRWCAEHFSNVVDYSQTGQSVEAGSFSKSGEVEYFNVISVNHESGERQVLKAKHVVIAAGGKPNIPKSLPQSHPRMIHSSQYMTHIHKIFPEGTSPRRVAVIGAGQSAAECWYDIPKRFPDAQSLLLIRGSALRPSDDSPFVNEVFNPERVDDTFSQDPRIRSEALALDKATNYGVVRLELLERIYDEMYSYKLQYSSESDHPHRILNHRSVTGLCDITGSDGKPAIELQIQNDTGRFYAHKEVAREALAVDLLIVATGYKRDSHEDMLCGLKDMMPAGQVEVAHQKWGVGRDYAVDFAPGTVASDAGVWLQGCNEKTHGLSDTLLSILAVRGGEMVDSIFGYSGASQRRQVEKSLSLGV